MTAQAGLCRTCSETTLLVFPRGGSNIERNSCAIKNSFIFLFIYFFYYLFIFNNLYDIADMVKWSIFKAFVTNFFLTFFCVTHFCFRVVKKMHKETFCAKRIRRLSQIHFREKKCHSVVRKAMLTNHYENLPMQYTEIFSQ